VLGFVYSIGAGYLLGRGNWTETPFIDFENERLLLYFLIFLLGALYCRQDAFAGKPKGKLLYIVACATAWIPVTVYIFALLIPLLSPTGTMISPFADWLIYWASFYVSLLCLMYLVIETFWRYLGRTGRIRQELNRNSFYVYLIHVIVIGVTALLLLNTGLPSLVKYVTLVVTAYVASNLIVSLVRWAGDVVRARG
jgi:fucose 4-O-acetylase-like acetyltransferase